MYFVIYNIVIWLICRTMFHVKQQQKGGTKKASNVSRKTKSKKVKEKEQQVMFHVKQKVKGKRKSMASNVSRKTKTERQKKKSRKQCFT